MADTTDNTKNLAMLAAVAAAGYALYLVLTQVTKIGSGVASAVGSATNAATSSLANAWVKMTSSSMGGVPGNVLFPDGNSVALAMTPVKTDSAGNVYVMEGGALYQLGQSDANGNWPATLVLTPPS